MGCTQSLTLRKFFLSRPQYLEFRTSFKALKLTADNLLTLALEFERMDTDGSGEISVKEFFRYLDTKRTPFAKRCFCLFDYDDSGELDFREFVISLWNYCTSDSYALMSFAFDLYDLDNSGSISSAEMVNVCKEVYGTDNIETNARAKNIVFKLEQQNFAENEDREVHDDETTKKGFVRFCKRHPALLFPAFMLQETLCNKICGKTFWKSLARRRDREFGKEEIDINWLRAQVTRNAFVEIAETIGTLQIANAAISSVESSAYVRCCFKTSSGYGEERKSLRSRISSREDENRNNRISNRIADAKKVLAIQRRETKRKLSKRRKKQGIHIARQGSKKIHPAASRRL